MQQLHDLGKVLIYQRVLFTYTKRAKEINTSGQLGGVKNDLCNGTTPDPIFLRALILKAINAL